jgi:predicted outer membrane protein
MMLKRTRVPLAAAAVAVVLPTAFALSQSGQNQGQADRPPQQQDQQQQPPRQLNGRQGQQLSPEQAREMAQKWFEGAASANQFEIESSKLVMEKLGGQMNQGQQPGQQPGQRPGQGAAAGQDPGARPGGGAAGGQDPAARSGQADQQRDPELAGAQVGQRQPGMQGEHHQQLTQAAQMIQRDHEQAQQALRQAAEKAGIQISETPELNPVHRAKLDELREKQGEDFARCWVFGNMGSHTHGILEYTWASEKGPSQEVKDYATQILPKLQQHAQHIAPIAYQMAGIEAARTAGERMGGEQPQPGQRPGGAAGGTDRPGGGAGGGDRPDDER